MILDFPTEANVIITRSPQEGQRRERLEDATLLALKRGEGAVSQGVQVSLEAGKGKNKEGFSPRDFGRRTALPTP